MDKYNEVTTRYKRDGGREFPEGTVIRTCSLSEKDAKVLNGMTPDTGVKYVKIESTKVEAVEETEKKK